MSHKFRAQRIGNQNAVTCPRCHGSKVAPNGPCSSCNMKGHVSFHQFVFLSAVSHKIDLENMALSSIPFELSHAVDAYRISLERNSIVVLPENWTPLVNLVELRLGYNKIECLPSGLSALSTLLGLHVQNNRLTSIPSSLASLNRLRRLDANGNSIEAVDMAFGQLWGQLDISISKETLLYPPSDQIMRTGSFQGDILEVLEKWRRSRVSRVLSLTHRSMRAFPLVSAWTTSQYKFLTSIDFSHNFIESVPSWLECMSELKILKLTGNPIQIISRGLARALPDLIQFDVDWKDVKHSPGLPWIENGWVAIKKWWCLLEENSIRLELTSINLENCNLHEVGLICGSRLQSLHIKGCHLSSLSSCWSLLSNISVLEIDDNPLMVVESAPFQKMNNMSNCSIRRCNIDAVETEFFETKWYLTTLNLSNNNLKALPSSIGLVTALTSINLNKNNIECLPETWASLSSLILCTMRKNFISNDLENLLKNQSNLQHLDLSYNCLQNFPCNPKYHTNLECLDVSHNAIESIKHGNFSQLRKLRKLKISDNSLHEPILELPLLLELANDLHCVDFSGNPMTFLPENCKKNATKMLCLLETLQKILRNQEICAEKDWDSTMLSYLLSRSNGCIMRATIENVGLIRHPKELLLHDIVELNLSYNRIDTLSNEIAGLSSLKSLNLSNNAISKCNQANVQCFHNLDHFDVTFNLIESPPAYILESHSISTILEWLNMWDSANKSNIINASRLKLFEVPLEFLSLNKETLTEIDFSYNQISMIPDILSRFQSIVKLFLNNNRLQFIPQPIFSLSTLKTLCVQDNDISEIPHHIASLFNLEIFQFDASKITYPETTVCKNGLSGIVDFYCTVLESFSSPYILNFKNLPISIIPRRLLTASNAVCVIAEGKEFSERALEGISESKYLTELILPDCKIRYFPEEVPRNLKHIDVRNNNLSWLPLDLFQGNVEVIIASNNLLMSIPVTFSMAPLKCVDFSGNKIRSLAFFGLGLPNLQELNLSDNFIRILSDGIASCPALKVLKLSQNSIIQLWFKKPAFLSICTITLAWNKLTEIPVYMADFVCLVDLDLRFNAELSSPPVEICDMGVTVVRTYLQRFRKGSLTDSIGLQYMNFDYIPISTFELTNLKILDLSNNKFKDLPGEIEVFHVLETLVLDDNLFEVVPTSVMLLTALKVLSLARNLMRKFDYEILDTLVNLETLCLLENHRTLLSPSRFIYKLELGVLRFWNSSLKDVNKHGSFDMSFNKMPKFPVELSKMCHPYELGRMTMLNLSHTTVSEFEDFFLKMTSLEHINLSNNSITQWPLGFEKMSKLKTLNMARNRLTSMPVYFLEFDINYLNISENCISSVSAQFIKFAERAEFKTNKNPVENWPRTEKSGLAIEDESLVFYFECLKKSFMTREFRYTRQLDVPGSISLQDLSYTLKSLNISENCTNLDPQVSNLVNLITIRASNCSILEIPSLDKLINLTSLDVSCNQISIFPVHLLRCKCLVMLNLARNKISNISVDLRGMKLSNLEYFNLSKNQLTTFPSETHFPRLKTLLLANNLLKSVPFSVTQMPTLEYLSLAYNDILICHSVFFANLTQLKKLNLSFNKIEEFPMNLLENTNLEELLIIQRRKVCVKMPPQMIISKGRKKTFEFLHAYKCVGNSKSLQRGSYQPIIFESIMMSGLEIHALNLADVPLITLDLLRYVKIIAHQVVKICLDQTACDCIPKDVFEICKNLKYFSAMETNIEYLSCIVFSCESLETLQYSSPRLMTPDVFAQSLGMSHANMHLKQIWNALTDGVFDISGQSWNRFPNEFHYNWHMPLPSESEAKFTDYFGIFANLMRLNVSNNFIFELPECMFLLTSLTMLDISNNCISTLSDCFNELTLLVQLHIHENPIKCLPFSFGSLLNLNTLSLNAEEFDFPVPDVARKTPMEVVRYIAFIGNAMSSGSLSMVNQSLTTVPASIFANTIHLTSLNLHDNSLGALPHQLSKLFSLQEINISKNVFSKLPNVLFQLVSLEIINLDDNLLNYVSWQLFSCLHKLRDISFLNNPLEQFPEEIRLENGGARGIATHLRCLHDNHESSKMIFSTLGLKSFPTYLLDFSQTLKYLNVQGTNLKIFPAIIAAFARLETLIMDNCRLSQLSPVLGTFHNLKVLSLSHNNLKAMHAAVAKLPVLQELCMNYNEIVIMACNANSLVSLEILELSFNKLSSFDDLLSLPKLKRLSTISNPSGRTILNSVRKGIVDDFSITDLDVSYCELSGVGEHLSRLQALSKLNLGNNNLQEIPSSISALTKLTKLYLNNNQITRLENWLMNATSLQSIYLAANQIGFIHQDLGRLVNLKMLDLQENEMEYVPGSIRQCTCLEILLLTQNIISGLHSSIFEIPMLLALKADGNRLTSLPKSMVFMKYLKLLSVSQNNLTSLPSDLTVLTCLRHLIAHTNNFKGIPLDLAQMNLQTLDMSSNALEGMTEMKITTMSDLNFARNRIRRLDENIGCMVQLIALNISENEIEFLPASICDLVHLQILVAHHNKLKQLPPDTSRLVSLKMLVLNDNLLEKICDGLSCARRLREINLHNNKLSALPDDFENLDELRVLTLKNNLLNKAALSDKLIEFGDKFNAGTVKFEIHPGSRFAELHSRKVQFEMQKMNDSLKIEKYIDDLAKSSKILW